MLTSPVNVTIATANGAALKPQAAPPDAGTRREPSHLPANPAPAADAAIEPGLPSNSLLTHVNAVAATAGNRTILQELSLNVAAMLKLARRPDEPLTALFIRIIAAVEAMPQAERLQFEVRSGLKGLKITLTDLAAALRKPDGSEAARLTAIAEAPAAVPGRAAVTAATTTYLQEGTADGHTEETLAMRAAARNSAAGQTVFTAEGKVRPADAQPDAKVLQAQLKSMFEPGAARPAAVKEEAGARDMGLRAAAQEVAPEGRQAQPLPLPAGNAAKAAAPDPRPVPPSVEKAGATAQSVDGRMPETARSGDERPADRKAEVADRRMQTMLTLKGLVEVVSAIPAKAAEILAGAPAEAAVPLPEQADEGYTAATPLPVDPEKEAAPELIRTSEDGVSSHIADAAAADGVVAEAAPDEAMPPANRPEVRTAAEDAGQPADAEWGPLAGPDLARHGVPFAYAQLQPAREETAEAVAEGEAKEEDKEEAGDQSGDGEQRRPRDEYDAIHDPLPEEEPAIVITRDSTEADRAYALYQRMGGF